MITILSIAFVAVTVFFAFYIITNVKNLPVEKVESKNTKIQFDSKETGNEDNLNEKIAESEIKLPKQKLSTEQNKLISMLGYPDEFLIIFDEGNKNCRTENWIYAEIERYFLFIDGNYEGGDAVIPEPLREDNCNVKPEDFIYGMTLQEVSMLIGEPGDQVDDSNTELTVSSYANGLLICTFNPDGKLINVIRKKEVE